MIFLRVFVLSENCSDTVKRKLSVYGEPVLLSKNEHLNDFEGCHADMQLFKINEREAVAAPGFDEAAAKKLSAFGICVYTGTNTLSPVYPKNIAYNVLQAGDNWFHYTRYTDKSILEKAHRMGKKMITVKQGYSACSSVYFSFQNLLLSGDNGIIAAAKENNYDVCTFTASEKIKLEGYAHGFIGGCCGVIDGGRTLLVNGDLPGQEPVAAEYLTGKGIEIINIGEGPLTDIGGMITFTI